MAKEIVDYSAGLSQRVIDRQTSKGRLSYDEVDGYEKRCNHCTEFWPLTSEFWYEDKAVQLRTHGDCKACYRNRRKEREANRDRA